MKAKIVCRVNGKNGDSVWYKKDGTPRADFRERFPWFHNVNMPMPFDPDHVGYVSVVENIEDLMDWCNESDITEFEKQGYSITIYETDNYKEHKNHMVAKKDSLKFICFLKLDDYLAQAKAKCCIANGVNFFD